MQINEVFRDRTLMLWGYTDEAGSSYKKQQKNGERLSEKHCQQWRLNKAEEHLGLLIQQGQISSC